MAASDLPEGVERLGEFKGEKGDAGTITSVSVVDLPEGSVPTVTLGGTPSARTIALGVVRGKTGAQGLPGFEGVPTDEGVAQLLQLPSATREQGDQRYALALDGGVTHVRALLPTFWQSGDSDGGVLAQAVARGGRVILPRGKIVSEQTLVFTKTTVLEGAGCNLHGNDRSPTLVEFPVGVNGVVATTIEGVGSTIRSLELTSKERGTGQSVGVMIRAGRMTLENVLVSYFGSHAVHIDGGTTYNAHIINTYGVLCLRFNGGDGLHVTGQANASTFSGLDIANNKGRGIYNEGRAMMFFHPHILNNAGGAITDNGIANVFMFPYVENGANGVDAVIMLPGSTGGYYFMSPYGNKEPVIQATGGGGWVVYSAGGQRREVNLYPAGGPGTGVSMSMDQGIYAVDTWRMRLRNADGSTLANIFRAVGSVIESMVEHRFALGVRFGTAAGPVQRSGAGDPNADANATPPRVGVAAPIGSQYMRTDGGAGTSFYVKESGGSTATGWVAK